MPTAIQELPDVTVTVSGATVDTQQQEEVVTRPRYSVLDLKTNTVTLMSSSNVPASLVVPSAETKQIFRTLADEWLDETAHLSNPVDKFMHPALVQIIGMGKEVVPLLLEEIERKSGHWFYALENINRMNPVPQQDQWSVEKTADAWLEWGRKERLI